MPRSLILLLVALPAAIGSFVMEARRRRYAPTSDRPYTWGYFQGLSGILLGAWASIAAVATIFMESADGSATLVWLLLAAAWGPAGFFVLKRRRWAWVLHTVASLNPAWWIINSIYAKNRWAEFERGPRQVTARVMVIERIRTLPATSLVIAISVAWALALGIVVWVIVTDAPENALVALILLCLAYVPTVVSTVWLWGRLDIARWHFGKLVLLWIVALVVILVFHDYEGGVLSYYAGVAFIPPLIVMTWAWLGGRESRAP